MSNSITDMPLIEPTVHNSIKVIFPDKIKMSGFPYNEDFDDWNRPFHKTDRMSDDCPIYRIEPYTVKLFRKTLPTTKGAEIYRKDGIWVLLSDGYGKVSRFMKYGTAPQADPFGNWSYGKSVSPYYE
jgi:hypothetical protein